MDILAARSGNIAEVKRQLDADPTLIETADDGGMRLLTLAAYHSQLRMVRFLVQRGANTNATGFSEMTALSWAAAGGHKKVVAFLLSKGTQVNSRDDEGITPLMKASKNGHLGVVRLLAQHLDAQGLEEGGDDGWTALHWAAHLGQGEVVRYLLGEGAQATSRDLIGATPFLKACSMGRLGVVRVLAQHIGAQGLEESDSEGWTALHCAAEGGYKEMVVFLLSKDAQASRDNEGTTPLMKASAKGHLGVVRLLAEHLDAQGLDEGDDEGWTALHLASRHGHSEIVAFLLSKGAQATSRDLIGATPFLKACSMGRLGVVRLFVQHLGAQGLEERDNEGETALHYAAAEGKEEVVRCLLLAGADPTSTENEGYTPRALAEGEYEEDDDTEKEGKAQCIALFEWWDVELERRAILARATCLHRADTMRRDMPTSQVPTYLEARVAAGHAVPRVEVVSPQPEEQQQEGEDDEEQTGGEGKGTAAGEGNDAREAEEGQDEVHAVLEYVVKGLNEELAIELLEGFHREK